MDQLLVGSAERHIINLEHRSLHPLIVLGRYSYKQAQAGLSTHIHKGCLEICFLERGTQTYSLGDDIFQLTGGDVLINGSNVPHGTNEQPEEIGCLYWLQLDISCKSTPLFHLSLEQTQTLFSKLQAISNTKFRGVPGMKKDLDRSIDLLDKKMNDLESVELYHHLLGFILKVLQAGHQAQGNTISTQIKQAQEFIETHYEDQIILADIAAFVGWSEPHLKQVFKTQLGIPPGEYLQRTRIKEACNNLERTDLAISEIAYKTGFSSQGYFSTVFKKHTGKQPGEYRKSLVENKLSS